MRPLIKRLLAGAAAGSLLLVFCTASATEILRGDINGDGVINSADQRLLLQAQGGSAALSDLNSDGLVDDVDADLLWQLTFGSLTAEELEQLREQTASTSTTTNATETATTTTTTTRNGGSDSSGSQTPSSTTTSKPSPSKTTTTTTKKPTTTTTTTTTKKPTTTTTTTTTKPTTTTTKPPAGGTVTAQVRPTLTKVTKAPYTPSVKSSSVKDSAYVLKVKNSSTGTVYDNTSQTNLQKMLAYIVKNEMGTAKFATNSTAAWKAQAVAAYTHLIYSYNNKTYTYGSKDLNLNDSNDKKIYNAVGEVLGVKILDSSNKAICAYYSGSAAGTSRNNQTGYGLSYIQPVFSPETEDLCSKYGYTGWSKTYTYTLQQIMDTVASKTNRTIYAESESGKYPLYAKSWTGAYVDKTNLYYMSGNSKVYITGRNIREYMGIRSASFVVTGQSGDTMTLSVLGHGHGMGLSQVGAVIFANEYSWTYEEILAHYFGITSGSSHQLYGMNW